MKKTKQDDTSPRNAESPSRSIDARIEELGDWRGAASLEGNAWRAIDLHEGAKLDEPAFKALIRSAVTLNTPADRH